MAPDGSYRTDETVLAIFHDLPGQRGCDESELAGVEAELGVAFPDYYRQIMLLDAHRLINTGVIIPPQQIPRYNNIGAEQANDESPVFVLPQVVFAVDDIRAIFAMDAVGSADSLVYEFDHYNEDENSRPVCTHSSLRSFFAEILRKYLGL